MKNKIRSAKLNFSVASFQCIFLHREPILTLTFNNAVLRMHVLLVVVYCNLIIIMKLSTIKITIKNWNLDKI